MTLHSRRAASAGTSFSFTEPAGTFNVIAVDATDERKVGWIERRRFHRDENFLLAENRFKARVELIAWRWCDPCGEFLSGAINHS
jgi:hypothetical protein